MKLHLEYTKLILTIPKKIMCFISLIPADIYFVLYRKCCVSKTKKSVIFGMGKYHYLK